jgi:hypothetical protein
MPAIRCKDVGFLEWPNVGAFKHLLELLDVIDDAFNIHPQQYRRTPYFYVKHVSRQFFGRLKKSA